ncbi:hypothetical protein Lalb_Chr04g0248851 [Lupinus albus]|uniref:Uncharacterized protein n=1 Tax=Lupinus albus TaxID=3870 RepID=A0A6A4QMC6_LUPAL|nr:hypothetical protein Lalb_Chr04g0248851 [Lupinus albus]
MMMMMGKKSSWVKKMMKKEYLCSAFKWKKTLHLQTNIMDTIVFKILSFVEALVLVSTLCFFYFCCGGHFFSIYLPFLIHLFLITYLLCSSS